MTLLNRYLLRRNLFLLLVFLSIGTGIYILTDLFHRIDVFLDAGMGARVIAFYYLVKLPLIISQILPAIFLLSLVLQLSLMRKNREMVALEAGGVSPASMTRFVLVYGLLWALLQFVFAQALGVMGERYSAEIWQNQVKKRSAEFFQVQDLWFLKGAYVVNVKNAWPEQEKARDISIYELDASRRALVRTYRAESAATGSGQWQLEKVRIVRPGDFAQFTAETLSLPVNQDLKTFRTFEPKASPSESTLGDLYNSIARLEEAGTNVDLLRTELHRRYAYAASILVMGMLALVLVSCTENLYLSVFISLVLTFLFYAGSSFFIVMGENGSLSPHLAAWALNAAAILLTGGYLTLSALHTLRRKI